MQSSNLFMTWTMILEFCCFRRSLVHDIKVCFLSVTISTSGIHQLCSGIPKSVIHNRNSSRASFSVPAMPISQRLLILVSFLAILHYGMPQTGSNIGSGPAISKRDDLSNYAVYGKNFTDRDQTLAIWNLLKDIVFDEKNLTGHGGDIGMAFWSLPMTDDDAKTIRVDAKVRPLVQTRYMA